MKNLINANRFNITFTLYLLLYAVCCNFSRLSLWVFVVLFCSPLGVCNQELVKLENLELLESLEPLEKPAPTRLKRKIRLESLKIRR